MTITLRWVVGATLSMAGAMGIGRFAYTPLLPDMAQVFGWNYAQSGDVASANFLGYLAGAVLAPLLARSPGVRTWVAMSLMASALTTWLGAEATTLNHWLGLRFAAGVSSAFCLVIITTHLMQVLANNDKTHLGNVHFAGVGVGILLCMALVYSDVGVATQWSRLGGLAAVVMALAWCLMMGGNTAEGDGRWQSLASSPVRGGRYAALPWRIIVGYGFFGFSYIIAATFAVAIAETIASGVSAETALAGSAGEPAQQLLDARFVWVVVGAATIPSVYLWQWFAHRRGLGVALLAAYLTLAAGVFLAGWANDLVWLSAACVLLGGTFGGITALGLSAARALAPAYAATTVSTMTIAFSLGQLVGPAVAGRMADLYGGFFWSSAIAAALMLAAACLVPRRDVFTALVKPSTPSPAQSSAQ